MNVHFNRAPSGIDLGTIEVLVNLETIQIIDSSDAETEHQVVLDLDEARALLAFLKIVVPTDNPQGVKRD